MTIYNPSTLSVQERSPAVKSTTGTINVHDDLNAREERILRRANGVRDEAVFPLLRMAGFAEDELHAIVMSMLRDVQYGRDHSGDVAKFLGVVRTGINGTTAAPEVA